MDGSNAIPPTTGSHTRWTYDDFQLLPEENRIREIIDGEYFVTPSPNLRHQEVAGRLHLSIGGFLEAHPEHGRVFHSPLDVVFSFHDVVEPDLLFVASDQLEILTEKNVQGVPALVIEVLSPSTRKRDEKLKRTLYEQGGVREYWLVDPKRARITIYRRSQDGGFPRAGELTAEEHAVLVTPLLPGWSLPLAHLFR
jgi:Uma2 family endonuclease